MTPGASRERRAFLQGPLLGVIFGTFRAMLHYFGSFWIFCGALFLGAFLQGLRACFLMDLDSFLRSISAYIL